jgi:predicted lipid-binding transport protein (Tim44 family)
MLRLRSLLALLAMLSALVLIAGDAAYARAGGGSSSGSRGSRTFSAPPSTRTAPNAPSTFNRTVTQPRSGLPAANAASPSRPGLFGNGLFGGGLLGGLAAGFLGAGLFGLLFGHGLFGGMSGLSSILGLALQLGIIFFLARLAMRWWQGRSPTPAFAGGNAAEPHPSRFERSGFFGAGAGGASEDAVLEIGKDDFDAFERLLGEIQTAYGNEDIAALRAKVTPEMLSYFSEDLATNASRGVVNKISGVKLLQGDLAEAWREGSTEYATVAMHYAIDDSMVERASGNVLEGGPQEVTEIWTFLRSPGGQWILSAIQQD